LLNEPHFSSRASQIATTLAQENALETVCDRLEGVLR
jgi:hypothetical protein